MPQSEFDAILTQAIADLADRGYVSPEQVAEWSRRLVDAARRGLVPETELERRLRVALGARYQVLVDRGGLLRDHPGVARFTLERVKPNLRAELDRRLAAARGLIKLNREDAVAAMVRRFSGWATSVPAGGTDASVRRAAKYGVRKSLGSLPFVERRVLIDQQAKFAANLSEILAVDGGALAGQWHSRWRQGQSKPTHYDARIEHHERDGKWFMLHGNWAQERGLVKPGPDGYVDDVERPGELVFCSCRYTWAYALRDLPADMLTQKGREELTRVRLAA